MDTQLDQLDAAAVKARLAFPALLDHDGVEIRRDGALLKTHCPFHNENSPSFTIWPDHGHCFGCGWHGDIFDYWEQRRGLPFFEKCEPCSGFGRERDGTECGVCQGAGGRGSLIELARLVSLNPRSLHRIKDWSKVPAVTEKTAKQKKKPSLPRMRALVPEEIGALARLRGLSVAGIAQAAADKRVGFCEWPQFQDRHGCWVEACAVHFFKCRMDRPECAPIAKYPCWVVTDSARTVAQYRRLDGGVFERADGKPIKAWTKGSPTWPLGASEIGDRACVLLVEGGADMLAAYHFLTMFYRLGEVAVCAMLGGSCNICDEALEFFKRKRVRIVMDEDEPKPVPNHPEKPPVYPGREAAARWTENLTGAGAAVETFSLAGLLKADGKKVKDLNDLALCSEDVWLDGELKQCFTDFDF
jgi:hypothetical protein